MKPLSVVPLPLALALLAAASCAPSGYDKARREDTADAYARFLREQPKDPAAPEAKRRLAELEFQEARRQNTVLAYKRFQERFPESERKKDAVVMLENLRYEAAAKADTSTAWMDFLRDHPAGAHGADARSKLDECDWRDASKAGTAKSLEDYLARHPETKHRAEADKAIDDRRFAEAQVAGPRGLLGYLDKNPTGEHREKARGLLAHREALARAWLGEFGAAREALELMADAGERAKLLAQVDLAEADRISARLDPKPLEAFAAARPGPAAEQAKARAKALAKAGALKDLARRLDPSHYARPADELARVLAAPDPRDRWLAAEELGRMGARHAADALLEAATASRFTRVRQRAFEALQALFAPLPAEVREMDGRRRLEALRKLAQSPALLVRVAVLEEVLGEQVSAMANYQRVVSADPADLFAQRRLASLRLARGEAFGAAVSARELAVQVRMLVEQRSQQEGLSPLLLARTLCGARDDARAALEALQALKPKLGRDFPEDLESFTRKADDAQRLAAARLADVELEARAADKGFKGCDDDGGLRERLDAGEADRLRLLSELAARPEEAARFALSYAAANDPAPKIREAAAAALARRGAK